MSDLDMSDVLSDPELTSRFDVIRRPEVVNDRGRSEVTPECISGVLGVVCAASGNDLDRLEDQQRMGRHISVVTQYQLRGMSKDGTGQQFQPDLVKWLGDYYVVQYLDPYPHFGPGFSQAICGSIDWVDKAVPGRAA